MAFWVGTDLPISFGTERWLHRPIKALQLLPPSNWTRREDLMFAWLKDTNHRLSSLSSAVVWSFTAVNEVAVNWMALQSGAYLSYVENWKVRLTWCNWLQSDRPHCAVVVLYFSLTSPLASSTFGTEPSHWNIPARWLRPLQLAFSRTDPPSSSLPPLPPPLRLF